MKKIYMAGVGGMLGEAYYRQFKDDYALLCSDKDVNAGWLSHLDFRDHDAYRADVDAFAPDYLFHIGALTDLEYCEENVDEAYDTNSRAVEVAVEIANRHDIPLLYISTAGIFDGAQDTYDDWDKPNPMGHYARSKYQGERHVVENTKRYLICRAGWMMGGGPSQDKKFIQKLMSQIKGGSRKLHIVGDKLGTPTYTHDFAANSKALLESENWGLYNMVCAGITSRLEVAQEMIRLMGLDESVAIDEVTSEYYAKEYYAPRPPSERLINKKLDDLGMNLMRDWKVALKDYLASYYAGYLDES